jgi:acetyl-CoA carboxylase carboxyl transferase subunit alpha
VPEVADLEKALDFERPLLELEARIEALRRAGRPEQAPEAARLEERLQRLQRKVFGRLTAWQRVQLARHPRRPYALDLIRLFAEDFVELHGDRLFGDDHAIVGGLARLEGRPIVVVGHQKGRDTQEKLFRNFGMPHPEGYRKALRLMQLAERFGKPVLTLIDTPGAYPGVGAEERGQAEAIARNLREMAGLRTPIVAVVTGEGGSGGALALGVADRVLMLEHAIYSVISPEGCAAILWEDATRAREAAEVLRITAPDLLKLGVIDAVVPEPPGGAHRNWAATAQELRHVVGAAFAELGRLAPGELVQQRYAKFRRIGLFEETA